MKGNKIMKSLEALERIAGCSTIESHRPKWQEDYKNIENALKVLEIIKNNLNITEILLAVKGVCSTEEYELLKEVLL